LQALKERGEAVPPEDSMAVARRIKEKHSYICEDLVKEYKKYDADPSKFVQMDGVHGKTKKPWNIDVGYER
jgi:actin-related protein 3